MESSNPRQAFAGLVLPGKHVRVIQNRQNRSVPLPVVCDLCNSEIQLYPFVVNHGSGYRKYHVECAIRVGLVLSEAMRYDSA